MAEKLLILLLAAIALLVGGYRWGARATDTEWKARQAEIERDAQARYRAEVSRGDQAAAAYLTEHRDQEDRYEALDDQFKTFRQRRLPLVAHAVPVPAAAAAAGGAAPPAADSQSPRRVDVPVAEPALSLGAVWMWNSALTGRDTPAGACNAAAAAGAAEAACAAISGLSLDDAWDNHADNARSCARDRQRLQHLIDYVKQRETSK
jgi:hypothetical protein